MITDLIINTLLFLPTLLLTSMQALDFNIAFPDNIFDVLYDLCNGVGYVFPVHAFIPHFLCTIGIYSFRTVWALILRLKSFIPGYGN